jgi:hypothetical protein
MPNNVTTLYLMLQLQMYTLSLVEFLESNDQISRLRTILIVIKIRARVMRRGRHARASPFIWNEPLPPIQWWVSDTGGGDSYERVRLLE